MLAFLLFAPYFDELSTLYATFTENTGWGSHAKQIIRPRTPATQPRTCSLPIDTLYVDLYYSYRAPIGDAS
jgi:hypothetical protein